MSFVRRGPPAAVALVTASLAVSPSAVDAKTMRLTSRADTLPLPTLVQLCSRGSVALIEANADGTSRQVVLFAVLKAPPSRVYDVLMDIERYPDFLSTIDRTRILGRKNGMVAFEWALDLPLFGLDGVRLQRGRRPTIVESRGHSGDLRGTRERWELYPVDGGTLVAFYRALDIETGGFILRTLVDLEPSTESGANLSSGFIHLRGLERHLADAPAPVAEPTPRTGPVPPFDLLGLGRRWSVDALAPLLAHGQLAVIESHRDGTLKQVAILSLADVAPPAIHAVVANPARYPEFMPNISRQRVTRRDDGQLHMAWTLKTPVSSMSGTALMTVGSDTVEVNALTGDVPRARLLWRFIPLGKERSVVAYYTYSDIRAASWVTRLLLNAEPLLEHGMVAAAGAVAMTAMTARAEGRR